MVSPFTPEDRERILQQARETLARPLPDVGFAPPLESRNDRWRREATEAEATRNAERDSRLTDAEAAMLEARLVGMVESERAVILEIVGETLGLFMKQLRDEIAEQVGLLKAETTLNRTIDKAENITELPNPLQRRA
jgi:hypothetical protein